MSKRDNMISFRLTDEELVRVDRVVSVVIKRNPHLRKANVMREMLGVIDTGIITSEERAYLKNAPLQEGGGAMTKWRIPITEPANREDKNKDKRNRA